MKTQTKDRDVTISAGERSTFQITEDAKIFHMLISGLYANKPQSITREIWSNARDAHVDAGCPERPFDVTFPSVFDSTFKVRDYGTGMDHDTIMNLYTNLGTSTKEDSNDGVGKFGIGSKSPFSYTDTFSVVAYDGKTARYYTAMIENGGIPSMNMMGERPCDEEPGIEVSFPVDSSDVNAFRRAAQRVSYGFEVKPNVINSDDFEGWIDLPVITEGPDWKLLSGELEGYGGTAYAKMGCVLYPINIEALDHLTSEERAFLQTTVVIDFPIGDLEITPSRESLSYGRNEPTTESIVKRVRKIVTEVVDGILKDYEQCDTYWAAVCKYKQHMNLGLPDCIKRLVQKQAMWRGESVTPLIPIRRKGQEKDMLEMCQLSGKAMERRTFRFDRYQEAIEIQPGAKTVMVVEDLSLPTKLRTKRVAARIRAYAKENDLEQVLWVKFHGSGRKEAETMLKVDSLLEGIEVIQTGELAEPPKTVSHGVRAPVQVRIMDEHGYRTYEEKTTLTPDEMDEGGVYVRLYRNQPQKPSELRYSAYDQNAVRILKGLGVIDKDATVYGVPKTLWKDFEGDEWVDLFELLTETYEDMACAETVIRARAINEVRGNSLLRTLAENMKAERLSEDSDAVEAVAFYNSTKAIDTSQADNLLALTRAMDKEGELDQVADETVKLEYYTELLQEQYPLIEMIGGNWRYSRDKGVDMMMDYIYTCDIAAEAIRLRNATQATAA